jgi:hypothetical protein
VKSGKAIRNPKREVSDALWSGGDFLLRVAVGCWIFAVAADIAGNGNQVTDIKGAIGVGAVIAFGQLIRPIIRRTYIRYHASLDTGLPARQARNYQQREEERRRRRALER